MATRRRYGSIRLVLFMAVVLAGLYGGCGIKKPPVPPPQFRPPAVNDLRFSIENGVLHLTWTAPPISEASRFELAGCSVYRSIRPLADADCENCPVPYEKVASIPAEVQRERDPLAADLSYRENLTMRAEYSYKVVCFTKAGATGDDSNVVNFIH